MNRAHVECNSPDECSYTAVRTRHSPWPPESCDICGGDHVTAVELPDECEVCGELSVPGHTLCRGCMEVR